MLGDVDGLAVPHPRQHFARVMAKVPKTHRMRIRSHKPECITNLWPHQDPWQAPFVIGR